MPRTFNGTSDSVTTLAGGLSGFAFGCMLAVCRRTNESGWHGLIATQQSGGGTWEAYLDIAPSSHGTASAIWTSWNGTDHANTLKFTQADGWCIIACTKATGTTTPRYHKYVISSQTWTHDNGIGTVPNATSIPGGNIIFGNVAGDQLAGDIAAAALFGRTFSDQEIESLLSWDLWLSYGPMGAWLFDQAATAQSLVDWTGGGANQSAISGTTVTTGSLPGWNQSDGGIWVAEITAAAGGTDATVTPSTVAATATVPAVTLNTGSSVAASTVAATATAPAVAVQIGTTTTVGTVAGVATVGAAALNTGSVVAAATVAATGTVGTPAVSTGSTVTPSTVAATATVGAPTFHASQVVTASTVAGAATVPAPSITAGGSASVSPATVAATATVGAPALSTGERVTAVTVSGSATVPAPTVAISVTAAPATVAAVAAVAAPSVNVGTAVAALTVAALASVPAPTLSAVAAALVGILTATDTATAGISATTSRTGGPT